MEGYRALRCLRLSSMSFALLLDHFPIYIYTLKCTSVHRDTPTDTKTFDFLLAGGDKEF